MLAYVHKSGGQIIANKGATFYAVSKAVCKLMSELYWHLLILLRQYPL